MPTLTITISDADYNNLKDHEWGRCLLTSYDTLKPGRLFIQCQDCNQEVLVEFVSYTKRMEEEKDER